MGATEAMAAVEAVNELRLVGRVSADPEERELPSGDVLLTFRLVVDRPPATPGDRSKQRVDTLDCAVWSARLQRTVRRWQRGDWVQVSGSVRRRFYRSGPGATSRVEVEVRSAQVIRRAAT